jgi:hypothetical protein
LPEIFSSALRSSSLVRKHIIVSLRKKSPVRNEILPVLDAFSDMPQSGHPHG